MPSETGEKGFIVVFTGYSHYLGRTSTRIHWYYTEENAKRFIKYQKLEEKQNQGFVTSNFSKVYGEDEFYNEILPNAPVLMHMIEEDYNMYPHKRYPYRKASGLKLASELE